MSLYCVHALDRRCCRRRRCCCSVVVAVSLLQCRCCSVVVAVSLLQCRCCSVVVAVSSSVRIAIVVVDSLVVASSLFCYRCHHLCNSLYGDENNVDDDSAITPSCGDHTQIIQQFVRQCGWFVRGCGNSLGLQRGVGFMSVFVRVHGSLIAFGCAPSFIVGPH